MGGLQAKSMTSQRCRAAHKMADMRYYGNVMATTRWRLYVTMETLWQQQDGGYALLWKRFLHLQQYSHRLNFNFFYANLTLYLTNLGSNPGKPAKVMAKQTDGSLSYLFDWYLYFPSEPS